MPISATGNRIIALRAIGVSRRGEAGFTLTELMVVLVMIGLLASAVVFVLPDPRGRLIDAGESFAARARAAQQAAIAEMADTALWVSPAGYGFERRQDDAWAPIGQPPFEDRQWPEDTTVEIAQQDGERTRIIFDATGLNGPLDVTLTRDAETVGVAIGADGTIRVEG